MAIKILVTGDLHLGKRSSALPLDDSRASTRFTWEAMIQYILNHQIDMLLLTGDVVDRDNKFYEAVGPLQSGFRKLDEAGITVCMVAGNHDYDVLPQIVSMNDATNIHLLGLNGNWENKTFTKNGQTIRIMGWSFPERYINNDATTELLSVKNDNNSLTLAMLHGDVYTAMSRYNPLQLEKLKNIRGVDAWLLGHVHRTDVLCQATPLILYPGSPHALSSKEQEIHGPYLLTIENRRIDFKQIPLSPVFYKTISIDISTVNSESTFRNTVINSMREHISGIKEKYTPQFIVFDVDFTGTYHNLPELRKWGEEIKNYDFDNQCDIRIRTVGYSIQPPLDIDHLLTDPSYTGVLATAIKALETGNSNEFTDKLIQDWKNRFRQTVSLPVFSALHVDINDAELDKMAREYILAECMEIISELNNQRNEN